MSKGEINNSFLSLEIMNTEISMIYYSIYSFITLISPHIHNISFWTKFMVDFHQYSHINFTTSNLVPQWVFGGHSSIFSRKWLAFFSTSNCISLRYFQSEQILLGGFHLYMCIPLSIGNILPDEKQGAHEFIWQTLNNLGLFGILFSVLLHQ